MCKIEYLLSSSKNCDKNMLFGLKMVHLRVQCLIHSADVFCIPGAMLGIRDTKIKQRM